VSGLPSSRPSPAAIHSAEPANGTSQVGDIPAAASAPQQITPGAAKQNDNAPKPNPFATITNPSTAPALNPFAAASKPAVPAVSPFGKPAGTTAVNGSSTVTPAPDTSITADGAARSQAAQGPDRYVQIHQNLKKLRASVKQQMTTNLELKKNAGNMRREIRKSIGQLTGERGANKQQVCL
jgi:nucleoporin GLE1